MSAHTPGPWQESERGSIYSDGVQISGPDGQRIAYVAPDDTKEVEDGAIVECCSAEQLRNAHLIAAAPYLLAALEAVEAVLDGRQPIDVPGAVMIVRAAIAKARGGK